MRHFVRLHHARVALLPALALAGLLLAAPTVALGAVQPVTLSTATDVTFGFGQDQIVVGDFNADGKLDTAATSWSTGTVAVLLGNGAGGFVAAPGSPYAVPGTPYGFAALDVNRDGKLDLVAASRTVTGAVSVLLGTGAGSFAPAAGSPFAAPAQVGYFAVGDLNGDANPDLAIPLGTVPGKVAVLLGAADGTFAAASGSPFDSGATGTFVAAVGDFNKDGKLDVAATNDTIPGSVSVLLGAGNGTLTAATGSPFALGDAPSGLQVGDLNKDGNPDIVATSTAGNAVSVMLGNGAGSFAARVDYPSVTNPRWVTLGDMNGDGNLDVLAPSNTNGQVWLGHGDGTGALPLTGTFAGGAQSGALALGDFNGDGKADVLAGDHGGPATSAKLFLNTTIFPPSGTLAIAGGRTAVNVTSITIDSSAIKNAANMRVRNAGMDWSSWLPFAATRVWALTGPDGPKTVEAEFNNSGVVVLPAQVTVFLDRKRPASTTGYFASVKKGKKVRLRFRVTDPAPSCGKADVTARFYRGTKLEKTLVLAGQKVNKKLSAVWTCTLKKGYHTMKISATDVAGNKAKKVGSATLHVT